jgi:type II secretory pathway component GspD/PulD (secretin)
MKYFFFFTFFFFYVNCLLAQVPVVQEQALEEQNAVAIPQQEDSLSVVFSDPSEIEMIEGLDEPLERVKLRDQDANMILDMIQAITGRYILRPQNLPQVKINFDSMNVLTKRETLLALESLLAMNGIGITKIDSQFFKAVPATGMNAHVPIWLDVPASSLPPSQRIYTRMFSLEYVSAQKMREILNPMCTPNVSSLITFSQANSILITDSLLNLQRVEKIINKVDHPPKDMRFEIFWYTTRRLSADSIAKIFNDQWESVWQFHFEDKPELVLPSKINLNNPKEKEIKTEARELNDNNRTRVLEESRVATSEGGMADIPINKLGVTCRKFDKPLILEILSSIDLGPEESDNFITFWYNPTRFTAQQLASLFLKQWEIIWKNEFFMLPAFISTSAGDQLGVVCHRDDQNRISKIFKEMEIRPRHDIRQKLIPLYHASSEVVFKTINTLINTLRTNASRDELSSGLSSDGKGESGSSVAHSKQNESALTNSEKSRLSMIQSYTFSRLAYAIPDERSNGIFAFGIDRDLDLFTELIRELDTPLPMARIDTIFVMVDLSQANQRGIDALFQDLNWKNNDSVIPGDQIIVDPDAIPNSGDEYTETLPDEVLENETLTGGLKVPFLNSGVQFKMDNWKLQEVQWNQIFSLASSREDVRIFSTPSITVSHGGKERSEGESYIEIKDERKVGLPGAVTSNGGYGSSDIKTLEARTRLDIVNPRIRKTIRDKDGSVLEPGTVFMSVVVEASKFDTTTANTYEGQSLPTTKSRKASTDIAIRDGQIMVLGGFREVQMDEEVSKYNFLSDIPFIGEKFFTPTQRRYTPTELMIFIRPRIIDPENPLDDRSVYNSDKIDAMMRKNYTPVFRSPSGKVFGGPEKTSQTSAQDVPASRPSL